MHPRFHPHIPALAYGALVIVVALAAMHGQNNLLFWILGVMVAGLVLSVLISGTMMMGLRVRRLDPQNGSVGEPLIVAYEVRSRLRLLPAFNVHIEERPVAGPRGWGELMASARAWVMHIGPRESVHGEAVFWPTARGEARFDAIRVWTTFPFGLLRRSITLRQPQHTLIFPRLYELRQDVLSAIAQPAALGHKTTGRPGPGDDYFGLREYRSGDSVRNIAWKRSAMLDELVAIERSMPSPPRLRVILNLTTPTASLRAPARGPTARELEEQAISLTASLLQAAHHAGYEIGLTVPGAALPPIVLRRSHWHLRKILAALAGLDLDAERVPPHSGSVADAERAALVVVHPDRVDPSASGPDALHLTAGQLATLAIRPIGWDPAGITPRKATQSHGRTDQRTAMSNVGRVESVGAAS